MGNYLALTSSDLATEISYYLFGDLGAGKLLDTLFGIKDKTGEGVNNVYGRIFPNLKNRVVTNNVEYPIYAAFVLRKDNNGVLQLTTVAREDANAVLTKRTEREGCYLYNGTSYIDKTATATIPFPTSASEKVYFGCDFPYRSLHLEFSTFGSYTGLAFKYWDATDLAWKELPIDYSDGTSGTTQDGNLNLGTLTWDDLWIKKKISAKRMLWIEVSCTAVATPAVADVAYWDYTYDFPKHFIYGQPLYYEKDDEVSPGYTDPLATQVYDYCNMGRVVFDAEPLSDPTNHSLVSAYQYKNPQAGTYNFTFASATSCQVNGGTAFTFIANPAVSNYVAIPGMDIRFNTGITASSTATAEVSEALKYLFYALPNGSVAGTYQNKDISIGNILADAVNGLYIRFAPPVTVNLTKNSNNIHFFFEGDN